MTESAKDNAFEPDPAFLSALVTEHFVLQSASSTTVSEAGSRASLYVFSLSSSLVAFGFASQSPNLLEPLVATILPGLFLLGCFTVVRLVDTTVENNRNLRAITHIRRYYQTLAPEGSVFFGAWESADEVAEALAMLGTRPRRTTVVYTMATMVASINGLVLGVGIALLGTQLLGSSSQAVAISAGAVSGIAYVALVYRYQVRRYSTAAAADRRRWESTS